VLAAEGDTILAVWQDNRTSPITAGEQSAQDIRAALLDGDGLPLDAVALGAFEFTHVRLAAPGASAGAGLVQLGASLSGTAGMPALLGLGQAGSGLELAPFGALFLDPFQPYAVIGLGVLPGAQSVRLAATGMKLRLQAFALGPAGSGLLSNPVLVQL
jgi:hypothetical protein